MQAGAVGPRSALDDTEADLALKIRLKKPALTALSPEQNAASADTVTLDVPFVGETKVYIDYRDAGGKLKSFAKDSLVSYELVAAEIVRVTMTKAYARRRKLI